ncbi:MAG: response regulator, partial [Bacteroidetes bacterium]|nr:response regulator [Bacteroidota bacterium]
MTSDKTNIRILLAEDNVINQIYIKYLLTKHGFIVDTANNGLQVIEKFELNKYDIILMDMCPSI